MTEHSPALVIGAGPAGLMAAETIASAGWPVIVAEAMPTPARKFLMAGKSGLNLTRDEPAADFAARITGGDGAAVARRSSPGAVGPGVGGTGAVGPHVVGLGGPENHGDLRIEDLRRIVAEFGPASVRSWAEALGIAMFAGSTGRVFPVGMKASPLLRAWLGRLSAAGVEVRTRWRWTGISDAGMCFATPAGERRITAGVTVLALGGASWPRLGSDAAWVPLLSAAGAPIAPFRPANMGLSVRWSAQMARHIGAAVKGTALAAGTLHSRGEWTLTAAGAEGGGIYEIAAALRDGAAGVVDLAPDVETGVLAGRLARPRGRLSVGNWLRRVLGDPVKVALLLEWGQPLPQTPAALAAAIKALPLRHGGVAGLDRAISSAGGIRLDGLTAGLGLRAMPGVHACGEMLDWEAPTGGYLLTACLATGRHAGQAAARRLDQYASAMR